MRANLVQLLGVVAGLGLAPALAAIATQGRVTIDGIYPRPGASNRQPAPRLPPLTRTVTWPRRQAILQQLDLQQLLGATGTAVIVLRARVGDTLQEGELWRNTARQVTLDG